MRFLLLLALCLTGCARPASGRAEAERVVEQWLVAQRDGQSGSVYWHRPQFATKLYAVRGWHLLPSTTALDEGRTVIVDVRVDSSNQRGEAIVRDWSVTVSQEADRMAIALADSR